MKFNYFFWKCGILIFFGMIFVYSMLLFQPFHIRAADTTTLPREDGTAANPTDVANTEDIEDTSKSEYKNTDVDTCQESPEESFEEDTSPNEENTAPIGKWISKNQKTYYMLDGKKLRGLQKIDGKNYYFDLKGVQRTGWQKIDGNYYFFRIANGKIGYMKKSEMINGITLKKNGMAKLTKTSKAKLNALIKANKIVEQVTKPNMSRSEKLKKCYQYASKNFRYRGSPTFNKTSYWEITYALDMFDKGYGSCYSYGAALAFLANAVGYKDCYAISSGGHGWTEINGKVYDISWDLVDKQHSYYALSYDLSGIGGRPNYKRARYYIVKI